MRLIPAGAGKTEKDNHAWHPAKAHPRRCGENTSSQTRVTNVTGSSPQVRGKRNYTICSNKRPRLIPAGAGKTALQVVGRQPRAAHPRRCGENFMMFDDDLRFDGSSPQVRGKLQSLYASLIRGRLIPAGAGKTLKG